MIMDEDIYDYIVVNIPIVSKIFENNPDVCIQQVDEQWIIMHLKQGVKYKLFRILYNT